MIANRAARRRQAKCKHRWQVKTWQDGRSHRWCELCGAEEWRDADEAAQPTTREDRI